MIKPDIAFTPRIVNHLLLQSSVMNEIGLYYGKAGAAILFYFYARYMNESAYEEFADELVQQVYDGIHIEMPINLEHGLCGIAWGLCHLMDHGFIEGDPDEVLGEVDEAIMEHSLIRMKDWSVRTGLEGVRIYVRKRIELSNKYQRDLPFDQLYLNELKQVVAENGLMERHEVDAG